jgi:predicted nucleic acid-binding protein
VIDAYIDLDIASQRHPKGARNMGKNDLWIAASAMVSGAYLLTTDGDFDHLVPDYVSGSVLDRETGLPTR